MIDNLNGPASTLEEDVLAFTHIPRTFLEMETNLFTSKWFDYRFMSPVQATRLYAQTFEATYRDFYGRHYSTKHAENVKPLPDADIFRIRIKDGKEEIKDKIRLSGLWRGRQFADAMGMPYDVFLDMTFAASMRFGNRNYLPRPQMLYTRKVVERVLQNWEERQAGRLYLAEDFRFKNAAYMGTSAQNDHHEWLFRQAEIRSNPAWFLADFVYRREILPEAKVRARLDADALDRVQAER